MRKVCIVNNFNYFQYLGFCLDSVVSQTVKFDAVYVVDDGSTDASHELIERYAELFPYLKPIFKNNAGQLSCFNAVVDSIDSNDLVFLLDSDDFYPKDYLENFLEIYRQNNSDMYLSEKSVFENEKNAPKTCVLGAASVFTIPASSRLTQIMKCWVGRATSAIVVTGELYKNIFPYPHESDWITRADDILVFASSLAGCSKTFISSMCIGYRVHGENNFFGKDFDKSYMKKRKRALRTLFLWCYKQYSLKRIPSLPLALNEYKQSKQYYQIVYKISAYAICVGYVKCLLRESLESFKIY